MRLDTEPLPRFISVHVLDMRAVFVNGKQFAFFGLHSCPAPAYLDSALSRVILHAVGGSLALGEVQADLLFEDCKGIALELQGVIQKIIDWTVELNFGEAEKSPLFQFDIERKASFEQIMQAVDRKIPVSRSELYSSYGLPEPKDEDDAFVMEGSQMLLTDGARSSGLKKTFHSFK